MHITGESLSEKSLAKDLQALLKKVSQHRKTIRKENLKITKKGIRDSVTPDVNIIHAINTIEELDYVSNKLVKRLRMWYATYNPEMEHNTDDHREFVQTLLADPSSRSKDSMGGKITGDDLTAINAEAQLVEALYAQRDLMLVYLEGIMEEHTPNIKKVATATVGAKLISIAGSLRRLSMLPGGTVQILGAETALFRHLRNRKAKPPKHGVIFNHPLLQRSKKPGRVARALGDNISIASRVDYFKGEYVGDKLYEKVERHV